VLALEKATAEWNGKILFDPSWGTFDMAVGSVVTSVFGGPADRVAYGETVDFVAKRVPTPHYSAEELALHQQYANMRKVREEKLSGAVLEQALTPLLKTQDQKFPMDWLLRIEALELLKSRAATSSLIAKVDMDLARISRESKDAAGMISDGIRLSGAL
jgi:phenylalanine-4-hydroxylase